MKKLSLSLALLAAFSFANHGGKHHNEKFNDDVKKIELANKEYNKLSKGEKEHRKKQAEKDLENCFAVCENGIVKSDCGIGAFTVNAKHYQQNKKVAETCGK